MNELKVLLALGVFAILFDSTTSNRFKEYGVLDGKIGDLQIYFYIMLVVKALGNGSNNNADLLLEEVINAESGKGYYRDTATAYGEGLGQFDRIAFEDVKLRASSNTKQRLKMIGVDLDTLKYEELRSSPLASIALIRVKFLLVPSAIPTDFNIRYQYYKKYYNSVLGKATLAHYTKANSGKIFFS